MQNYLKWSMIVDSENAQKEKSNRLIDMWIGLGSIKPDGHLGTAKLDSKQSPISDVAI